MLKTIQYIDNGQSITSDILMPFIQRIAEEYNLVFEHLVQEVDESPTVNYVDEVGYILWTSGFRLPGYFIEQVEVMLDGVVIETKPQSTLDDNKGNGTGETTAQSATATETQTEA